MPALQDDYSQVVLVPSPAAGAGFTFTPSGRNFNRIRTVCFQVVTSSAVASRIVYLDVIDGGGSRLGRFSSGFTQTASLTTIYTFGLGMNVYGADAAASLGAPLAPLWLELGGRVTVGITAVDSSDQVSDVIVTLDQISYAAADEE